MFNRCLALKKKLGYFRKSCHVSQIVTITLGYQSLTGHPTGFVDFLPTVLLSVDNDKSAYFGTLTELSD